MSLRQNSNEKKEEIEKLEKETLDQTLQIVEKIIPELQNKVENSKKYLRELAIPLLIASEEEKTFNPFANMIEKYIEILFVDKARECQWELIPLGFSSDLCFETSERIIHLDIKTANIDNTSDFRNTTPVGVNQFSYPGILPIGIRGKKYASKGVPFLKVYPNLPAEYRYNDSSKLTITLALQFIYPSYKNEIDKIRDDYLKVLGIVDSKLLRMLEPELDFSRAELEDALNYKPKKSRESRREIFVKNIVRGIYIHKKNKLYELLNLNKKEEEIFDKFKEKLRTFVEDLKKAEIRPIAYNVLVLPNGKLAPLYDDQIVSGKNIGNSIRHHYELGEFELLGDCKRSVLVVLDEQYREELEDLMKLQEGDLDDYT